MELRDCPLIFLKSLTGWPPVWVRRGDHGNETLRGEVGVLKEVRASILKPYQRCFLIMEHDGAEYVGCLLFRDKVICRRMYELLVRHRGRPLETIGGIDVSALVSTFSERNLPVRRPALVAGS